MVASIRSKLYGFIRKLYGILWNVKITILLFYSIIFVTELGNKIKSIVWQNKIHVQKKSKNHSPFDTLFFTISELTVEHIRYVDAYYCLHQFLF